jgi:hypothetical protein
LSGVVEMPGALDVAAQDGHVLVPREAREIAFVVAFARGRGDAAGAQAVAGKGVEPARRSSGPRPRG